MDKTRSAQVQRKTRETEIEVTFDLDGTGVYNVNTGIPFFNHLLELFSKHGRMDLEIHAEGDIEVDFHHLVEDTGIVMGEAFRKAIGDKRGIKRYATVYVPMDEALVRVCIDISNRPFLTYEVPLEEPVIIHFNAQLIEEFFRAFAFNGGLTMHVDGLRGKNAHHVVEAVFKAFGACLGEAARIAHPGDDVPSTKGVI